MYIGAQVHRYMDARMHRYMGAERCMGCMGAWVRIGAWCRYVLRCLLLVLVGLCLMLLRLLVVLAATA